MEVRLVCASGSSLSPHLRCLGHTMAHRKGAAKLQQHPGGPSLKCLLWDQPEYLNIKTRESSHYFQHSHQLFSLSVCQVVHLCSHSHHRRRCPLAAEALALRWVADWGPPSSQNPGWFPPADTGWPGGLSSWGNSHRSERTRWPLEILYQCWSHLSYASGWTSYPWHLNRVRVNTKN